MKHDYARYKANVAPLLAALNELDYRESHNICFAMLLTFAGEIAPKRWAKELAEILAEREIDLAVREGRASRIFLASQRINKHPNCSSEAVRAPFTSGPPVEAKPLPEGFHV